MLDFISIKVCQTKNGVDIFPEFLVDTTDDLMIRGRSFYAVYDEETGLWSTKEDNVRFMVDKMLKDFVDNDYQGDPNSVNLKLLKNFSSNQWVQWQKYSKSLPDNFHELDKNIMFSNTKLTKDKYATKRLSYPIKAGDISAYTELMTTLYDEEELRKLEWSIGAIISGDSKRIQKFMVLYGPPGSGKSTILNIIQGMFEGYWVPFESKNLVSSNNSFALEDFKDNPLIAIEHDGDLNRIEDNTRVNSIVSHETLTINEKFKAKYSANFQSFLYIGTNKPVKITDSKSGLLRRLIDVVPSGRKVPRRRYDELMNAVQFEYGAIAQHCLETYLHYGEHYYDAYVPLSMMGATNDFYNFMEENYNFLTIDHPDGVSLSTMWLRYKEYCMDANITKPYSKMYFRNELGNYFDECLPRYMNERFFYRGLKLDKFEYKPLEELKGMNFDETDGWLKFNKMVSPFDEIAADWPAQYAKADETPSTSWSSCRSKLKVLDTRKLHYVKVPQNLIVIDFDIKDEKGNKSFEKNLKAASKWPETYAELSKSGQGIHLHYYYEGDTSELSRIYDEDIEIKVFNGNSSLRRMVTKCNNLPIRTINSGLPRKGVKKVITDETIKTEQGLRKMILRNLRKEIHADTTSSINFIYQILEDAYNKGLKYDVTDMKQDILLFAVNSTHQSEHCVKMVNKMRFKSDEPSENVEQSDEVPIVFFDVEVFPNLLVVVWKKAGEDVIPVAMINPKPEEIREMTKFRLIGFNNRKYDNHILYARMMGYTNEQLYKLSRRIIDNDRNAFFGEAYNLSYTDIYDFLSASNKMSLKKWEIKMGIHHMELGLPWDKPVDKSLWPKVGEYCINDVIATEKLWNYPDVIVDWEAREILAELSGLTVNDTTNQHTMRIIVGTDPNPQSQYIYTDLSTIYPGYEYSSYGIDRGRYNEGAKIVTGKSIYRGEDPGEGGYVYSEPGMYSGVALLDVISMHPHSAIKLKIFGEVYTLRFEELVDVRIFIKHKEFDQVRTMMDGKLSKYLNNPKKAKKLANGLKTAINSVYGLTSANFPNKLRDPRNKDNIVAKYGALFMINLKHEVQERGFTVAHIKTDSIKIPNATPEIIQFVMDYGKKYGFTFEHEATYRKMCIVNDAVYVAQYESADRCLAKYGYSPSDNLDHGLEWTATGTQFQVPYVFKTLFSHEKISFSDLCETKSVTSGLYLDMNSELLTEENMLPFNKDGSNKDIAWDGLPKECHDLRFIGKVGSFCPIKPGCGGGVLLRASGEDKYAAAVGTKKKRIVKGEPEIYYWLESETVRKLEDERIIDRSYYDALVDEAIETISKYGDFERFASNDPDEDLSWLKVPDWIKDDVEEIPFPINPPVVNAA